MSIKAGLNYSQINEKFSYSEGNIVQVVYILNNAGDTIGSYMQTGNRIKKTINKYRTLDIPILLGYELGNGNFHANLGIGTMINLRSWQTGEVLDMSLKPTNISSDSASKYRFKTNIGAAFLANATLYYKVNNKFRVFAEPYLRYNLSTANDITNLTLKQKYITTGLRFGIRKDL
jgi:hypothetical protein